MESDLASFELCVVGGGLAGLSAACTAAEQGLRVLVVEQGAAQHYACNSRYAGGMMHLAFEDPGQDAETLAGKLREKCPADLDAELLESIGRDAPETMRWLRNVGGARFFRAGPLSWQKWCLAPARPRRPGLVWPGRGPDVLLRGLEAALVALGGTLRRGVRIVEMDRTRAGYEISALRGKEAPVRVRALAVVLAEGGFGSSVDLIGRHISPTPRALLQRNSGTGNGLALALAETMGLGVTGLNRFYGHLVSGDSLDNARLWPWPTLDEIAMAGVLVDSQGYRFTDESRGGVYLANALASHGDAAGAFILLDDTIWHTVARTTRIVPSNPFLEIIGATMYVDDDLAGLAKKAGMDASALEAALAQVSRAPWSKTLSPPFRLIPVRAGITYSMGGLKILPDASSLDISGRPVPGLFAAGSTAGGAEGGETAFYLGGLCKAAILGRRAGVSAAAYLRRFAQSA